MSPIKRMTSAFSSAGDRSSRFPGGDMPLQNLKSRYAESPDLPIFTRAVSHAPPAAAASKTSAARTFAPITIWPLEPSVLEACILWRRSGLNLDRPLHPVPDHRVTAATGAAHAL